MATATNLITQSFKILGVLAAGETPGGDLLLDGYEALRGMMGQLGIQSLLSPFVGREVFALVAGKGGPSNPYTIGPGGDFNTSRPNELNGAGLLLNASVPLPVEIPRTLYTDDAWESIQIKDLQSGLFTGVYYNLTYPLGQINLWPIPNTSLNSLVLYRLDQLGPFASLTASYDLPPGYDEMLPYNLAKRLSTMYGRQMSQEATDIAITSLANCKRQNYKMNDFATDPALTQSRRGGYNIDTGEGS